MGKCKRRLLNGKDCGLPTNAEICHFHSLKVVTKAHGKAYENYVANTPHKLIDLSSLEFEDITFGPNNFPLKTPVNFTGSKFTNCVFASGFDKDACFRGAVFKGTQFIDLIFDCDTVDFAHCTFDGDYPPFVLVHMSVEKRVGFDYCNFQSRQDAFYSCWINTKIVDFSHANIRSDRLVVCTHSAASDNLPDKSYPLVIISDRIDLSNLRFDGHFFLTQADQMVSPEVILTKTNFAGMRSATFSDVDLSSADFDGATLGRTRFINVQWEERSGRKVLHTDNPDREKPDNLQRLASTYMQLKKNFEEARDFIGAGDWFYREMECRRRLLAADSKRGWWQWLRQKFCSFTPLYRYVSSYGENYTRPLWFIAGVLVAFALIYFYWTGYPTDSGSINYEFAFELNDGAVGEFLGAIGFSAGVMLLQFIKLAAEQPSPTPILAVFQVILTLILVPLFLLALRRRFRR